MARPTKSRPSSRVHGDLHPKRGKGVYDEVYALVRRIPKGRVMTYGQIAELIEHRLSPRAVGWAMNGCPDNVPWQRVVNASGRSSTDRLLPSGLQQAILEKEGIEFDDTGALDLDRYRYRPRRRSTATSPASPKPRKRTSRH
jgi:methylated-DNA-protein-cysteine methyltransferase-like protein